eukprot:TRINITY_DN6717_c0_g1_i1.p1 TRINITY_DN6717_c0_g1~~TRINITY_DN6717_c0_g1_i1.p1  ORF type:complete len:472 (-),score=74.22 TRINITY_DN6717_c0_g1_i1:52-1467(-)
MENQRLISNDKPLERIPLIGIELAPGFTKWNLITFFYASFVNVAALVFLNSALPYLLTNFLKVPVDEQGDTTGSILLWNEVIIIATITMWGIASDKIGRRIVYVVGFGLMGASIFVHTWAPNFDGLIGIRAIFAVGAAASTSMLVALLGDYPVNASRGKSGGIVGLGGGLGAVFALFVLLKIPDWANLETPKRNGEIMYWAVGAWIIISGMILLLGLSPRINEKNKHVSIKDIIVDGFKAGKNPRIALSYLSSFAARGDAIVLTTYLTLWINNYEIAHGVSNEEALAKAGVMSGIAQTLSLVIAPFFGFLADRLDRVWGTTLATGISAIGYLFLSSLKDPTGGAMYGAMCLVGTGEIAMIVASQVLLAAEAPDDTRGAVSGFWGLCAGISILFNTRLGGYLFDNWSNTGPFLIVGLFNLIVLIFGLVVSYWESQQKKREWESMNAGVKFPYSSIFKYVPKTVDDETLSPSV